MHRKNLDLIVAMFVALANIAWTQVPYHLLLVNIPLALPLIFFLPGYTVTQILFHRRSADQSSDAIPGLFVGANLKLGRPIGNADLLVLSLGLSLTIDILVGFGLNIMPIGLTALSWTLSLGLITTIGVLLVAFMRHRNVAISTRTRTVRRRITITDTLLFGLSMVIVGTSIWLTIIRPLNPQPSFSQFWILPANQAHENCAVSVGVQSFETISTAYHVVLTVNGIQTNVWPSIVLTPQQKWMQSVTITPDTNKSFYVEAKLYRNNLPDVVYRDVHLIFYVSSINKSGYVQKQCSMK